MEMKEFLLYFTSLFLVKFHPNPLHLPFQLSYFSILCFFTIQLPPFRLISSSFSTKNLFQTENSFFDTYIPNHGIHMKVIVIVVPTKKRLKKARSINYIMTYGMANISGNHKSHIKKFRLMSIFWWYLTDI